ncbi:hypothetical protein HPB50_004482 [Hyalomma asiaticum]|uniref:Uncharacterized protein n=1 Tax=Hyalomma asiaticum TaxID=266040 RepID=A0ACB7SB06_HYAAI|nr:hypothetical protein HPB50_004482 [Hyalomma asiaticum]
MRGWRTDAADDASQERLVRSLPPLPRSSSDTGPGVLWDIAVYRDRHRDRRCQRGVHPLAAIISYRSLFLLSPLRDSSFFESQNSGPQSLPTYPGYDILVPSGRSSDRPTNCPDTIVSQRVVGLRRLRQLLPLVEVTTEACRELPGCLTILGPGILELEEGSLVNSLEQRPLELCVVR